MKNYEIDDFENNVNKLAKKMTYYEAYKIAIELERLNEESRHYEDYRAANVIVGGYPSALEKIAMELEKIQI